MIKEKFKSFCNWYLSTIKEGKSVRGEYSFETGKRKKDHNPTVKQSVIAALLLLVGFVTVFVTTLAVLYLMGSLIGPGGLAIIIVLTFIVTIITAFLRAN